MPVGNRAGGNGAESIMPDEPFMRHHYGASGCVDPYAAYEAEYAEFERYWAEQPGHIKSDIVYRAVAVQAFMAARGFELGGKRR
jgi:hypothetical protein